MSLRTIFFLLIITAACGKPDRPEGVLSRDQMVHVLSEIYLAEDKVQRLALPTDSAGRFFDSLRARISQKTAIPDSVFRKSMDYYTSRPVEMEQIYTALVDSLSLREQRSSFEGEKAQ